MAWKYLMWSMGVILEQDEQLNVSTEDTPNDNMVHDLIQYQGDEGINLTEIPTYDDLHVR
uniref:CSON005008 protein n=1 Tax=Culicoides sonorensis TaxID=179676 RepID=A0A336N243_CULSO